MKPQSAHLSDDQIGQLGNPSSRLEPEAEDRWGAHLAECASCRNRLLLSQRAHLAFSTTLPMNPASHPDCPNQDDLRDLAAGLCTADRAAELTEHASRCDHCGHLLRIYTEDFADELSPEGEAILGKLKSSSVTGRKKLVRRMLDVAAGSAPSREKHTFSFFRLAAPVATLACAVVAIAIWLWQRETPERVEKLVAQAYTENRNLEMRIPLAAHAGFHQLKGDSGSLLSSPESLRKATDEIALQLKKNPSAPDWLLLSARVDLLDWRYKSALATLDKVDTDSPMLRMTRALALYEKAEMEHNPQDYGEAVDLLGKNLQQAPDDPVALFNQGVACEKIYMYECASRNYEHLLKLEKDSGWAGEARDRLNRIKEKKTPEN